MLNNFQAFSDRACDPAVHGFLHAPDQADGNGLVLTHGAGANCKSSLVVAVAKTFAERGITVLRCDLPFRHRRSFGPPHPGDAARDREGLKNAVAVIRRTVKGRIFLGGHSYGGRQATMLCAEEPEIVSGLLLLSYPLHPPRKPEQMRTQHFSRLQTRSLFVHGTRDAFGTMEEMENALRLIPTKHGLLPVEGAGHDLGFAGGKANAELPRIILDAFGKFFI